MALIINVEELGTLSVTGRLLKDHSLDVITDVVRVIKRAEIRRWNPVRVFTEVRISLDIYRAAHPSTALVDITYNPHSELINLHIFREVVSLSIDDIRRISLMTPSA